MMRVFAKKLTAWLCCMAMLATLLPAVAVPAFAAEGTALTATSGTLAEGSYYLTDDLTLTGSFGVRSNVTVDLNGHTIFQGEGLEKSVFIISAGAHLTLKDSAGNGKVQFTTTTDGTAGVANSGEFTLESGTLTGWKREGAGGMVYLYSGATFTMNGGMLTGCEGQYGCAIRAAGAGATVNINGGTITGNNTNSADYSIVDLRGTADGTCKLNITGGTIKGNTSCGGAFTSAGKEIYCRDTEVTITGGDLGYIHSLQNKTTGDKMDISGKTVIQSVYVKDTDATPSTISKLVEGASITANGTSFEIDDTVVQNGNVYTYGVKEPEITNSLDFSANNSIKLGADTKTGSVSLTNGKYILDLNGKTVTGTTAPYITVGSGATLTIRDSAGNGKIQGITAANAMLKVAAGGKLVLESGTLTGHDNGNKTGGAIYNAGTVEMTGGAITGNVAKYGGAILLDKGSVTNISGGVITDNRATYRGGALSTPDATVADEALQPVLNISGGSITANRADNNSATMYIYTSKVTISGGIMGFGGKLNATTGKYDDGDGAGDIWIRGSVLTITGGKMDDLATRPDTNFNFTLNISGNPEIEAAYPAFTVGNFTTTAAVGTLTSGAYIKSNAEIPVAADAENVHVSSSEAKGCWFYRCATDNVDDEMATTDAITNVTIQPGADETGRNFNWFSVSDAAGYVTYAKAADLVNGAMPANAAKATAERETSLKPGYYHNKASITGLEHGTVYAYQLSNGGDVSPVYTFEVEEKSDSFKFAFVGDPQLGQPHIPLARQVDGWTRTLDQLTTDPVFTGVDLVVSAGDQVTSADANGDGMTNSTMYNAFTNHEEMTGLTFAPTLGNHDSWTVGEHYQQFNAPGYMVNPATGKYYGITENYGMTNSADYWFVYNSVLFINLNVNDFVYGGAATHTQAKRDQNKQTAEYHLEFIDKVLELTADDEDIQWKVIVYHESPYGSSYHGNYTQNADGLYEERPEQHMFVDMREYLLPGIYERDFDVVLSGHDHTYTRSHILKHEAVSTDGSYYGNETITPFESDGSSGYYTYADGTTTPTFVNWTDGNGVVHTDKKTASLPVKVTNPDGVLHITASSSSGSTNNAAVHEHPAVAVVHSGREPKRQAVLVEVTPTTLTFTNYGLGTASEDYVLEDNVIDTFTIERVEIKTGTVAVEQAEHGTVSVDKAEGKYGETVTVTTKSDSGYKLKEVLVDGVAIKGKTFTIQGDHVVTAVFVERGDEPILGRFSLQVIKTVKINGANVDICRWVWTPFEE